MFTTISYITYAVTLPVYELPISGCMHSNYIVCMIIPPLFLIESNEYFKAHFARRFMHVLRRQMHIDANHISLYNLVATVTISVVEKSFDKPD